MLFNLEVYFSLLNLFHYFFQSNSHSLTPTFFIRYHIKELIKRYSYVHYNQMKLNYQIYLIINSHLVLIFKICLINYFR